MMSTICIIPARGGSKGIPQKNIKSFCGKPLIYWSIKQAMSLKYIDVYVSTEDNKIAEIGTQCGATIINRPQELAEDNTPLEPVLLHAINKIKNVENIILLQPTSPLRTSADILEALEKFKKESLDSLFSACILEDICLWKKNNEGFLNSFTYDYNNRGRRQDRDPYYLENGSIYIFKSMNIHRGNRLYGNIGIFEMPYWKSFELDNKEDWEMCELFMSKFIFKEKSNE